MVVGKQDHEVLDDEVECSKTEILMESGLGGLGEVNLPNLLSIKA